MHGFLASLGIGLALGIMVNSLSAAEPDDVVLQLRIPADRVADYEAALRSVDTNWLDNASWLTSESFSEPAPVERVALDSSWSRTRATSQWGRPAERERNFEAEFFAGLDGSKQPQDFGVNAQFGGRMHANFGIPLISDWGLGLQVGAGVNLSDHAVAVTSRVEGATDRQQIFTTVGLYQRMESGWIWGFAYDALWQDDYDDFSLSQWRAKIGYQITDVDEIGIQGRLPGDDDSGFWGPVAVRLSSIGQASLYWTRRWESGADLTGWVGVAEGHGQVNVALGDQPATNARMVFGSSLHIPLNDRFALVGEANFVAPADTGTVDAYLGIVFYPGGGSWGRTRRRSAPVLNVANNTSFSVDLSR